MTGEITGNKRTSLSAAPYRDYDYPLLGAFSRKGTWRAGAANFRVEELTLYPFSGTGEHVALLIEKENLTTRDLALAVATALGIPPAAVGYAGMKDKDSVSVQAFTVTHKDEARVAEAFAAAGAKVLSLSRHGNKLRLGHLAGNRFSIFLEGGDKGAAGEALGSLAQTGVPNWFGPQRFGASGGNAMDGLLALTGKKRFGGWKYDLAVSSLQSLIFNELLARRLEAGSYSKALTGDVMQKIASGGLFVCEDAETDQLRVDGREISPTGPMHGKKMKAAQGGVAEAELEVLAAFDLTEELFRNETGTRRAFTFYVDGAGVRDGEGGVWLDFACPSGCFATSVVREIAESGVFRR